jgi:hypothetical protein
LLSIKKTCAALFTTALLGVGIAAPASAANNSQQAGLVNVSVGDVSVLDNANVGVAANVAAEICGVNVGPVAILAVNTAATGTQHTVCMIGDQAVTLTQAQ